MTLTITDRMIRSAHTRHTATAWPVPGEPARWTVTWLPGRNLTRDQAQAAMNIAEAVGQVPIGAGSEAWTPSLWEHLDSWAAVLGISGPRAIVQVTDPEPEAS
jgi:hypothetical protein